MENNIIANAQVNIPDNSINNNTNEQIIQNAKIGFEGTVLSEGQLDNWAGKTIDKIQEFLGFKHNWDEVERLSIETGLSRKQILEIFGTYKTKMLQTYLTHLTNEATFGITGESEFSKEQASESFGGSLAYATAGLVGNLLGVEGGFRALSLFAKTAKYVSALTKIDTLLSDTKFVKWMATNDIQTNLFYRMAKEGAKWGTYGAVTSFIQNAPQYATIWQAIEKATPEAIINGLFGLGLPMVGAIRVAETFKNPLIKAVWTIGLRGSAGIALMEGSELGSKILTGEGNLDITTLWNAIKAHDTLSALTSIMNLLFSAAIGVGAQHYEKLTDVPKVDVADLKNKDLEDIRTNIEELSKTYEALTKKIEKPIDIDAIKEVADLPKETEIKNISDIIKLINAKNKEGIILIQGEKPLTDFIKKPEKLFEQNDDIKQVFEPETKQNVETKEKTTGQSEIIDIPQFEDYVVENEKVLKDVLAYAKAKLNDWKGYKKTKNGLEPKAGIKPDFLKGYIKTQVLKKIKEIEMKQNIDKQFLRKIVDDVIDTNEPVAKDLKLLKQQHEKDVEPLYQKALEIAVEYNDPFYILGGLDLRTGIKLTKDLIESTTVKITKSNFFTVYFIPPHLWQYAKNPIIKQLGKSLNEAKFDVERETLKYRQPAFNILDETSGLINEAKKKLGKDFKGFIDAVSNAIVKGDIEQRDPKEIFKEKGKYLQHSNLANRLMENHKKFYDTWREGINTFAKLMVEDLKQNKLMSDEVIQKIEKYIYSQINEYPYYMHRQRDVGNVWVLVRNEDGKVVHREHIFDPLAWAIGRSRKAKKVIDKLKKKYGDNYIYEVTEPNYEDISKADLLSFIDVLDEVLHNSKISDEQRKVIFENFEKQIKAKGFMATSIHRSKNLIEGYNKNPFDVMVKYNAKASSFLSKQLFKHKLNNIYEQQHSLWDNRLKRAFKWHVNELMRNKNALDKVVGYTRGLMFLRYIALNLKNLFVNIVFQQPITLMHLSAEFGGKLFDQPKAFAVFNNAVKDLITGNLSEKEKQILKQLDELKVTTDQRTQFTLGRTALITGAWNRLMNYAGVFMKYSEIFNRKSAALSYMRAHPELSGDELLVKTRAFVYLTNGKYGDNELAVIFQGGGAFKTLGKIGQTFQTYNHQVLAGMLKLIGEKQFISLLFGMGTLMFMGGLAVMPNYQAIKSFYTKLTGRDLEIDVREYFNKYRIGFFKWFLDGGLIGNLPFGLGTDISSSAAISMPFDDLNFTGHSFSEIAFQQYFGVGYQALKDMWKSIKSLQVGDYNKAVYYCPAIPKAFGNIFKALHDYKWGLTTNGDLVIYDPFTNQPMKPTEKEALLEALGFLPERLAQFKNMYYSFQSITQYFENQRKILYNKYRTAIATGNKKMFELVLKQMEKLNAKIQRVNVDYGMSLPYANVHSARTILNNRNLRNFLYSNLGGE